MKHLKYREDIDALRGIAVALVVIYHAFPYLIPGGFIGVDIFFVISGYLITSIMLLSIRNNEFSLATFYARRIRRLFPALLTVLTFTLLVGWLILFPDEYKQLGEHVSKSVIFWLNFTLIDEVGYFDIESHYKPLLHLWTLSVEEQYYLIWPLLLLVFLKFSKYPVYLFGLVTVASLFANLYFASDYTQETYYHTFTRFWQLSAGSLLAVILSNTEPKQNRPMFIFGVIIIVLSASIINSEVVYPSYWAILPVLGAVMVILANTQLPTYMGFSKLGLISYPLYLWHWVLISFVYIYLGRQPSTFTLMVAILMSFLLSYLTCRYIERLRYKKKSTPYLIISLVLVGVVGLYIKTQSGMPERNHISYFVDSSIQFKRLPAKDDTCLEYSEQWLKGKPLFNYCRSQNINRDRLIAIVGDSHSHVLFPGIANLADKSGYGTILLANSSCPPFKGFMWGSNSKEIAECQIKTDQILKILEFDERIARVIIATRGPVYIHGEVKGKFTESSVEESMSTLKNNDLTYKSYFEGMAVTIKKIEAIPHINAMFYLLENPELDFLPKDVIHRPFDYMAVSTNRNYVQRDLYLKRMSVYRNNLEKIKSSKLTYLDPMDVLCDKKKCYSNIEDKFLYADDDHFSVFGSYFIMKYFKEAIFLSKYSKDGKNGYN